MFRLSTRLTALATATIVSLGIAIVPAGAANVTAPPAGEIQSLHQRAVALEARIATASEKEQVAGEHYDQATVKYAQEAAKLLKIKAELKMARSAARAAQRRVRVAAVAAYVYGDSSSSGIATVLTKNVNVTGELTTYAGVATDALHTAALALSKAQDQIQTGLDAQGAATQSADIAVTAAASARADAEQAAASVSSALSEVKGQLAAAIAQQAAALAAAAAARAAAARADRAQAQQQAATAAGVAQEVASLVPGSSATAAAATAAVDAATLASSAGAPTLTPAGTTPAGQTAVQSAESLLGVPYVWGGQSSSGVDCSGLTLLAWAQAGVSLLHSAWYQYVAVQHVSLRDLEPGDLLFYSFPNDGSDPVTHVAMYVGSGPYGSQTVIQAPQTGQLVSYVAFYTYGFVGAGRP